MLLILGKKTNSAKARLNCLRNCATKAVANGKISAFLLQGGKSGSK